MIEPALKFFAPESIFAIVALCLGAVGWGALRYDRDNTALARTLARMRAPGEPIVFFDEYFFDLPLREARAQFERAHIKAAVREWGSLKEAAAALGISYTSLWRRLR